MQIASLPMYNFPEIRKASASLWRGIAKYLRLEGVEDVPDRLVFDRINTMLCFPDTVIAKLNWALKPGIVTADSPFSVHFLIS